jgi:sulfonate transport system substrate-binding protein
MWQALTGQPPTRQAPTRQAPTRRAPTRRAPTRRALLATGAATVTALAAGCGSSAASAGSGPGRDHVTLRLGFLANITHAPALVGVDKGFFAQHLGRSVTLSIKIFSSGTQETTAILAGQLDAAYAGPNPAINAWQKSNGTAIRIISGAASGGASLVVRPGITSAAQLKGKSLATPSLGNTQDVALRHWLRQHGLATTPTGGGDVTVKPTKPNSAAVLEFKSGQIDGGWEPAPYDAEMVADGGTRLVNEASLWPRGRFVTTNLMVTQSFLKAHPSVVNGLLKGQIQANDYISEHRAAAERSADAELTRLTGQGLTAPILAASFKEITFTNDPIASSLPADARHAEEAGLLKPVNLSGIYDLGPLNTLLTAAGGPPLSS